MRIIQTESHMGGLELLQTRHQNEWRDIESAIDAIIPEEVKTKVSREKNRMGELLYNPRDMNAVIDGVLSAQGWAKMTENPNQMLENVEGSTGSRRVLDFAKNGVGVEVQFGKYAFIAYDFVKFLTFYEEQRINVGVEITGMRSLRKEMSSGVGDWESSMQVLKTRPRGHPPMPLVLVGIGI